MQLVAPASSGDRRAAPVAPPACLAVSNCGRGGDDEEKEIIAGEEVIHRCNKKIPPHLPA